MGSHLVGDEQFCSFAKRIKDVCSICDFYVGIWDHILVSANRHFID